MEIQQLRYFLTVIQEKNITKAAHVLRISQPALSRQLKRLEEELGTQLMERTVSGITLTAEGAFLAERAKELIVMSDKVLANFQSEAIVSGELFIGGGETEAITPIVQAIKLLREAHHEVRVKLFSGNADSVIERLDKGLLDFGLVLEPTNLEGFDYVQLPGKDRWGILTTIDTPLASQDYVTASDLGSLPLIVSEQSHSDSHLSDLLQVDIRELDIVATYNLLFNASLLVREGVGYALCIDNIVNTSGTELVFVPFMPTIEVGVFLIWKKGTILSPAARRFLELLEGVLGEG